MRRHTTSSESTNISGYLQTFAVVLVILSSETPSQSECVPGRSVAGELGRWGQKASPSQPMPLQLPSRAIPPGRCFAGRYSMADYMAKRSVTWHCTSRCESQIHTLKKRGVFDDAIVSRIGKKIVFDIDKARATYYKKVPQSIVDIKHRLH